MEIKSYRVFKCVSGDCGNHNQCFIVALQDKGEVVQVPEECPWGVDYPNWEEKEE